MKDLLGIPDEPTQVYRKSNLGGEGRGRGRGRGRREGRGRGGDERGKERKGIGTGKGGGEGEGMRGARRGGEEREEGKQYITSIQPYFNCCPPQEAMLITLIIAHLANNKPQ